MMKYQQSVESHSPDGAYKTLRHPDQHWNEKVISTEVYVKDFPIKCNPMKQFRNFSVNISQDPSIK